ncbi:hypothetical protein M405DRAFT_938560 [Rhizopogon salebrosus TDB-379]|nr:hypothetical protein M405DRAFT_938560 [Rhizopogon salebrosus TDB-379]
MAMYRAISILPLPTPSRPSFDALDSADDLDIAPHVMTVTIISGDINSAIFATFPSLLSSSPSLSALPSTMLCSDIDISRENRLVEDLQAIGRWLVVFCDEINLPAQDKYGTQRVISFLRQLVECRGYWRASDEAWVKLERIQFPSFPSSRPLVMADYPGESTFEGGFNPVSKHFTTDIQVHYVYSPRELTRWVRGIYEAIRPLEMLSVEELVRVWAHEALRLFQDRLVMETDEHIDNTAMEHFPTINKDEALH